MPLEDWLPALAFCRVGFYGEVPRLLFFRIRSGFRQALKTEFDLRGFLINRYGLRTFNIFYGGKIFWPQSKATQNLRF